MNKNKNFLLAPIVLFVYNRPWHTRQTVEALQKNELAKESVLFVFADGPKPGATEEQLNNIRDTRAYVHQITGFKEIRVEEAEKNKGLANSVIEGVTKVIEKYGRAIVVEDDIVVHPFFLRFMNEALDIYQRNQKIFAISATMERFTIPPKYNKDIFLTYRFGSWGWATWADRWNTVDWNTDNYPIIKQPTKKQIKHFSRGGDDLWPMLQAQHRGAIDSWAIRMGYNMSLQNEVCLRPTRSLVSNIGMDGSGVHCGECDVPLLSLYDCDCYNIRFVSGIQTDNHITKNIQQIFQHNSSSRINPVKKIKRMIKRPLVKIGLYQR